MNTSESLGAPNTRSKIQQLALYAEILQATGMDQWCSIKGSAKQEIEKKTTSNWKEKALQILQILFGDCRSTQFRCAVDEKRDRAPDYYKMIEHPMDLSTLQSLVTKNTISCAKQFVTHLLLIWDNALAYNATNLAIYSDAQKLKSLSNKLIRQYWPNPHQNVYESKRKSRRIRKNKMSKTHQTRQGLQCGQCNSKLQFMCGFHVECKSFTALIVCNECKRQIKDTNTRYYHCVDGCQSMKHSVFICESCASTQCKIQKQSMAFCGLFLDLSVVKRDNADASHLWFEAIVMKQDPCANRVFYELVFSSETNKRWVTEAQIIAPNTFEVVKTKQLSDFTKGVLSDDGLSLAFIDSDNSDQNIFKKVQIMCRKCGAECAFMTHCMLPCNEARAQMIYCDTHHMYYDQQKFKHPTQRCLSFQSITNEQNNRIYQRNFYFSCVQCHDFDQCEICTMIECEEAFKKGIRTHQERYEKLSEPPRKRQRVMRSDNPFQSLYVEEKRKNQELMNENGVLRNELDIALLQNKKMQPQLQLLQAQKDEYCNKLNQLKQFLIEFD